MSSLAMTATKNGSWIAATTSAMLLLLIMQHPLSVSSFTLPPSKSSRILSLKVSGSDAVVNGGSPAAGGGGGGGPRNGRYFPGMDGNFNSIGDTMEGGGTDWNYEQQNPYFDPMTGGFDPMRGVGFGRTMRGGGEPMRDDPMGRGGEFDPMRGRGDGPIFDPMRTGGMNGRFHGPLPPPPPMVGMGGNGDYMGAQMGPFHNGGLDPESQKYFSGRGMASRNGMYGGDRPSMGGGQGLTPGGGASSEGFGRGATIGPQPNAGNSFSSQPMGRQQSQRYNGNMMNMNDNNNDFNINSNRNVYDADIYRDADYVDRIQRHFPVLSRLQGVNWQGHIQYLAGDLQFQPNSAGRRSAGIRYDLEADGSVFLTMTLGGRRLEMRGRLQDQRGGGMYGPNASAGSAGVGNGGNYASQAGFQRGREHIQTRVDPSSFVFGGSIRLDPMNEENPNYMILMELPPDTVLINEVDRYTGKVVLTASLSIVSENDLVQVSHDMGDLVDMPIVGHQVWSLTRPGSAGRQTASMGRLAPIPSSSYGGGYNERRSPTTGIPQPVTSPSLSTRVRIPQGGLGRLFPVLSKFAGITWEGDCRQVTGDLETAGMPPPLFGGSRFDIYDDGTISLTTFLRSIEGSGGRDGRPLQSIVMRGRRVDGPGSPIRLDLERGPNSMIITEMAPHTLLMNEVNRETGRVLFTSSLFLANDQEVVQVSHQISGRDARIPVDLHQVWRLNPAQVGYEEEDLRPRETYTGPSTDRSMDMRGGRSAWSSRSEFNPQDRYGSNTGHAPNPNRRTSINGLLTEPPLPRRTTGSRSRFDDVDPLGDDHLWLLNRSPEETRARFRAKFDQWDANRDLNGLGGDNYGVDLEGEAAPGQDPRLLDFDLRENFPVLSQISGIDWRGTCRYIIGDTKPDSIMLLKGGMRYDVSPSGVCTMTTTLEFDGGRTREVRMRGKKESNGYSMRLYPMDEEDSVYAILTEISPDTLLLNEVDSATDKIIYTASLSLSNDRNELVQVTHELGDGVRMPVEGHQVWRMTPNGMPGKPPPKGKSSWAPASSSSMERLFPVLSKIEGAGWQGTFRFINGDLERQTNFEATGKMWYDLNKNGTCVLTIVSSLTDGTSRYVQMRGDRPIGSGANNPMRLDPVDPDGTNYMVVTELPPDTVLLSEVDRFTGKMVSTASLSLHKDEIIQISHEIGNRTKLDGHQIARLRRSKERSSTSRGTMAYLLNGDQDDESYNYGGDSLVELFPVLNQIDGLNWQGTCRVVDGNMREQKTNSILSGGMRYDLHRNGTCTMTSVLIHPDGRTHQIKLQGTRVGKSNRRSIRLDPVSGESPFYTVLTEVPPDTILLNEVDKATNKVIFTASVSIADADELVQISKDVDEDGRSEDGHKVWRLRRSPVLGRYNPSPREQTAGQESQPRTRGQGFRPRTVEEWNRNRSPSPFQPSSSGGNPSSTGRGGVRPSTGFDPSTARPNQSYGTSPPFGAPSRPRDPNVRL